MTRLDKHRVPFNKAHLQKHIRAALDVDPAGPAWLGALYKVVKSIFDPVVRNSDNIPPQPCLFVGNHAAFALDAGILIPTVRHHTGRLPRAMADNWLWTNDSNKFLLGMGAVLAHPAVCDALMEQGRDLLVYPGGAREAVKPVAQKYQLLWRDHYGFVRLAAKHGYTLQPLAMVGPEEFYDHLVEGRDLPNTTLGYCLQRLGLINENTRTDILPPLPLGLFGSLLPKPKRCYIQFGQPVDLSHHRGKRITTRMVKQIRDQVATQIEEMLEELQDLRDGNKYREKRWRTWLSM